MPAQIQSSGWHWTIFLVVILFFLALDLGVFHRSARVVRVKEALLWSAGWFFLAMLFARLLLFWGQPDDALEFLTGYVIEFSLSMDNVFAIALIFAYFGVAQEHQHKVLFWGILGALVMRGAMIGLGAALIQRFHWVLMALGAFLVLTGIRWAFARQETVRPEKNPVIRLARKVFPIADEFTGAKFFTRLNGRRALTSLALVLLMVETTDLLFAVDSIPAIFAVTQKAFIVFTSNIFAILGLRSLYFVLAGAMGYFRYLKFGLSAVLVFIGGKMFLSAWHPVPIGVSLAVVGGIIALSIVISMAAAWRERNAKGRQAG